MKFNKLEKEIKNKMENMEYQVDTEQLIKELSPYIPQKNRRYSLLMVFPFMVASFLIVISGIYLFNNYNVIKFGEIPKTSKFDNSKTYTKSKEHSNYIDNNNNYNNLNINKIINKYENEDISNQFENFHNPSSSINLVKNIFKKSKISYSTDKENVIEIMPISQFTVYSDNQIDNNEVHRNSSFIDPNRYFTTFPMNIKKSEIFFNHNYMILNPEIHYFKTIHHETSPLSLTCILAFNIGNVSYQDYPVESERYGEYLNEIHPSTNTYSIGLEVNKLLKSRIFIKSGIKITEKVTQFNSKWSETSTQTKLGIFSPDQQITFLNDYEAIGHSFCYNLAIPISLSYKLLDYSRLYLAAECGIDLEIYKYSFGKFPNNDLKFSDFTHNSPLNPYQNQLIKGYFGDLELGYFLNDKNSFFIMSGFRVDLDKIKIEGQEMKGKSKNLMIGIGINSNLN